jgi:putative ABC transport system substrate-binding protein
MTSHSLTAIRRTVLAALIAAATPAFAADRSVDVTAIVDHPALNAVREGIKESLREAGFEDGKNLTFRFQSAQGNVSTAAQIARKFVGDSPDAIVAISTPSAQAVVAITTTIPVIYSAVGDPVAAKLVKSWDASGTNVTGVSDMVPADKQLDLIHRVLPQAKRIGIIYNPGEANSVAFLAMLKKAIASGGYELVESPAPRTVDVTTAAKSLIGKVDLIFAPTDNTVASAFAGVAKVADDAKVPLFAGDSELVKQGAAFGLAVNYQDIGRQTGRVVARVLKGEAPGSIASATSDKLDVYVNSAAAETQGVKIPADIAQTSHEVGK